eukprot:7798917-Pyramimonas_sp.AAC.1
MHPRHRHTHREWTSEPWPACSLYSAQRFLLVQRRLVAQHAAVARAQRPRPHEHGGRWAGYFPGVSVCVRESVR